MPLAVEEEKEGETKLSVDKSGRLSWFSYQLYLSSGS